MAMTPSSLGMYMGQSPGTPNLRMGTTPASRAIGTRPPRVADMSNDSNMPITHHHIAMPWSNREERTIRPGDQLFAARTTALNANSRRVNMVNLPLLNQILRDGRDHYREMVEAPRAKVTVGRGTAALSMQKIDNIRLANSTAGRSLSGKVPTGRPPAAYFVTPDEGFEQDRVDALLQHESALLGREAAFGYVPDERTIWQFDLADRHATTAGPEHYAASEAEHVRRQLEKYGTTVSAEWRAALEETLAELQDRDEAAENIVREFSRIKASHARYVTREGFENFWNYLGTVESTLYGQTNAIASTAAGAMVNYDVHGLAEATNIWGNQLRAAEDHLYLIFTARRDPKSPDTPGSIRDGAPFEVSPYVARNRQAPGFGTLAYYDLAGHKRYGKAWFVGRVRYDTKETRPDGARITAAGLVPSATYARAVEAGQTLDKVVVLQRVS